MINTLSCFIVNRIIVRDETINEVVPRYAHTKNNNPSHNRKFEVAAENDPRSTGIFASSASQKYAAISNTAPSANATHVRKLRRESLATQNPCFTIDSTA